MEYLGVETVKEVLMRRDGLEAEEADDRIADFQEEFNEILEEGGTYEDAQCLMEDHFGLEPDYLEEFMF